MSLYRALLEAPGERAGWETSAGIVVNDDCSLLKAAVDGGHIEIARLPCF